jgi:hypothetical protein
MGFPYPQYGKKLFNVTILCQAYPSFGGALEENVEV